MSTSHTQSLEEASVDVLVSAITRHSGRTNSDDWFLKLENEDEYYYPEDRSRDAIEQNVRFILQRYTEARAFEKYGQRPGHVGRKYIQVADYLRQACRAANNLNKVERYLLSFMQVGPAGKHFEELMQLSRDLSRSGIHGTRSCDEVHRTVELNVTSDIQKLEKIFRLKGELMKQADIGGRNQYAAHMLGPPAVHQLINDAIRLLEYCGVRPTSTEPSQLPHKSDTGLLQYLVDRLLNSAEEPDAEVPIPVGKIKDCVRDKKAFVASLELLRERLAASGYADGNLRRMLNKALSFLPEFPDRKEFHEISDLVVEVREKRNAWLKTTHFRSDWMKFKNPPVPKIRGANPPKISRGSARDIPEVLD